MDERHRRAQRGAATGDIESRARVLRDRVRMGELAQERVRFAAWLGHEASELAVGRGGREQLDPDFAERFEDRLAEASEFVLGSLHRPWPDDAVVPFLGSVGAALGDLPLATCIFALDKPISCPSCGAVVPSVLPLVPGRQRAVQEIPSPNAAPLPLDSPRWSELGHAYGSAEDVPSMLEQLASETVEHWTKRGMGFEANGWDRFGPAVHHQGDVYDSTYAAVPHLVRLAEAAGPRERLIYFGYVGSIVSQARERPPEDLVNAYEAALEKGHRMFLSQLLEGESGPVGSGDLAALAALAGHPEVGYLLDFFEEMHLTCPQDHQINVWFDKSSRMVVSADYRQ